jgi:hypothetical protein
MIKRQGTNKEVDFTQQFIDSIGFTKYHYLVFFVGALILIANGMQIILQAFLVSLLRTIEEINIYDLAIINFCENVGYSIAYLIIMFYGKNLKNKITIQIVSVICLICNGLGIMIFAFKFVLINRFFIGMCLGALDILIFVMLLEMFSSKIRGFMSCIILVFNPLGQVISSLIAFWKLDEQVVENNYYLLLHFPFYILIVVVILVIFFQESPRHLFEEGKYETGISTYLNNNKNTKVASFMRQKTAILEEEQEKASHNDKFKTIADDLKFSDLFYQPLNYTLIIIFFSLFAGFIYNGVYFLLPTNAPGLTRHEVLRLLLSVSIDIPSNIFASVIIETNYFGRLKTIMLGWIIGLICSLVCSISPQNIIFMVMIKFGITLSVSALIIYACELYPKNLRTSIVSLFNLGRRLSVMVAPLIVSLVADEIQENLVYVIFALICLISIFLNYTFKIETRDKVLDDLEIMSYPS